MEMALERLLRDVGGIECAVANLLRDAANRIDDLLPPAIIDRYRKGKLGVVPGALFGVGDEGVDLPRSAVRGRR